MPDVHFTDEQITQFRDGVLWNPVVASHLRSCPKCQNRLREARLLRVLLTQPEKRQSAHPSAEELAAYLERIQGGIAFTKLEAHVAGCPQCFADLTTIREQFQPVSTSEKVPPDWVVVRAAQDFHPPEARLNLGTLFVQWLNRVGPLLRLIPPSGQDALRAFNLQAFTVLESSMEGEQGLVSPSIISKMSDRAHRIRRSFEPAVSDREGVGELAYDELAREEKPEKVEPVLLTIGQFNVRVSPHGPTQDQVRLTISVARSVDSTPVSGVQLSLEGDEGPLATAVTGDNGITELQLPQGQARLVFQAPVRAELDISF